MPASRAVAIAWLPATLYMAVIWALSAIGHELPLVPPIGDKWLHFIEFAGLAFLLGHAAVHTWSPLSWARRMCVVCLIGAGWALLDEVHQAFVPGRYADLVDLAADASGIVAGALAHSIWTRLRSRAAMLRSDGDGGAV